ncbi:MULTISPECIES: Wadjet anti-phage system protein JetD domain-containing protein [unclassified Variovorax]|uniref:Wadjet anti-phage system protein JetD domain-containing protein n=1 Tax=unclassified Variovorax TaxID=663243 RepID=UPI003F465B05
MQRFANQRRDWIDGGGQWPLHRGLEPPTGSSIRSGLDAVTKWTAAWTSAQLPEGVQILRETYQMRDIGMQTMPVRIQFDSPRAIAAFAGELRDWDRVSARRAMLLERWPDLGTGNGPGRLYDWLAQATEGDVQRLISVAQWVVEHPRSGLYLRQLPVAGVDTKWIEGGQRRSVATLVRLVHGETNSGGESERDFLQLCGLRSPEPRIHVMALDAGLRSVLGGMRDVQAPIADLAALPWRPRVTLFLENLTSAHSLPDLESTVAVVRLGHAISLASALPWIRHSNVLYWGDIDTDGLKILSSARSHFPHTRSVLMDMSTLQRYRDRWVVEGSSNLQADRACLTPAELSLYDALLANAWQDWNSAQRVRLEQERLDWPSVEEALRAAVSQVLTQQGDFLGKSATQ